MNETVNSENNSRSSSAYKAFKLAVKLFTFLNFFLMLILISDFFLEPGYIASQKKINAPDSGTVSINISLEDSLKISGGKNEARENEQAVITPIFNIEKFHKYKSGGEDSYSVDLEPLALPFIAVLLWLIAFISVIKPRSIEKEHALMYQLLLLPVIVSLVYWFKLYSYILG